MRNSLHNECVLHLSDSRNIPMIAAFTMCCAASRTHCALARQALDTYGNHGPSISGAVRDHFPADIKATLRNLARDVSRYSDAAHAARPKGMHLARVCRIGALIATRDGSGFYGPQALTE